MARLVLLLAMIFGNLTACAGAAAAAEGVPIYVVAGPTVDETRLTSEEVALIFRRKRNFWSNGQRIQPVNLPVQNLLRRAFSQAVFGHTPEGMDEYWQERYFHGVLPPRVLASQEAVMLFVAVTPGAIGYLSSCPGDGRLHVVFMTAGAAPCAK
jgi:ABC-type phosphate transport system substrate-binding protein